MFMFVVHVYWTSQIDDDVEQNGESREGREWRCSRAKASLGQECKVVVVDCFLSENKDAMYTKECCLS